VRGAKIETINFLLDSGADINIEDKKFTTPLSMAKKSCKPQVINLLMSRGAILGPSIQGSDKKAS
jgi:ankyrin repeat protein